MAMRKAFTGGACAPGEGQAMGNNAFTNMMDFMISGGANAAQKAEGFGSQIDRENLAAMEAAFADQEKYDAMNMQFENMNMQDPNMMHPSPLVQEYGHDNIDRMNELWSNPAEMTETVGMENVESKFSNMPIHAHPMMGVPGMMGPMMHRQMPMNTMGPMMMGQREEVKVEEIEEIKKEDTQLYKDEMKEVTASMINDLEAIPSEKIQKSEFLGFLKKLNQGALKIEENGLEEDAEKMQEFNQKQENIRRMDDVYYKQRIQDIIEETKDPAYKMEETVNQREFGDEFDPTNLFRDVWDAGEISDDNLHEMMANWKKMAEKEMGYYNETIDEPPIETVIHVPKEDFFKFDENNPFLEVDDAFDLAIDLNEQLRLHDAELALKANLIKNPEHVPSWRLLGKLYQEKDEDEKAIAYFKKAYDLDPTDLDSLLCLGVSCTNELQEHVAMNHLLNWLRLNPQYNDLPIPEEPIQDIDDLRSILKDLFSQALMRNPDDLDVVISLGIIEFGERNYGNAADLFGKVALENPNDYSLWNKYGAALANNMSTEEALDVYEKTLALRPNLVRTWANVGIAY
jgi:peroxin-5